MRGNKFGSSALGAAVADVPALDLGIAAAGDEVLVTLPEESIVVDDRSALTPAQVVENKLMALLQEASLPVSQLQSRGALRYRSDN
jgi:hypothetical protein